VADDKGRASAAIYAIPVAPQTAAARRMPKKLAKVSCFFSSEKKIFFFAKKKQKTFAHSGLFQLWFG
jgi:hypothetical protein